VATTRTNGISVFAILGIAGLILTGCSSAEDSGERPEASKAPVVKEQSLEEACTTLNEGALELQTTLQEELSAMNGNTDPSAAAATFQEAVDLFSANTAKVTTEELRPTALKVETAFIDFNALIQAGVTEPGSVSPEELSAGAMELDSSTSEITEVCAAA
jgi:hypothetical protein